MHTAQCAKSEVQIVMYSIITRNCTHGQEDAIFYIYYEIFFNSTGMNILMTMALTLSYLATIAALSEAACANNTLSSTLKLCSAVTIVQAVNIMQPGAVY